MIVVLIVASIVIAMGFSVLNMVRKQVVTIQKNYQKKQQVLLLESLLHRDFNSNTAFYNIKNDELLLKNTRDSITYTFYENYIIRNQDTFQIEVQNKELYLDGIQVKDKVIDALEINLSENYGSKQLFVQQSKDASYYMNND
ncbi:hypothetical protein BTO18_14350 [Polaribacter porphyrae]|uniref:Uncharacterized protein n=2 Tax=Polaribacter porphyrae TaxID=1137780 RepID=A0A2S7WTU6_9FLAO|nr:hypothetical protein BTO18_14350 [Polaribacter porphyrae]